MSSRTIYGVAVAFALFSFALIVLNIDAAPDNIPVHVGPGGEVDRTEPKSIPAATFGVWYSVLLLVLVAISAPRPSFAHIRVPVATDDPVIPFSNTAADKAATLLRITERSLAWLALATVVPMCLMQFTLTFPAYRGYLTAAIIVLIASIVAALGYTFVQISRWPNQLEAMPTDDEERARQKYFGFGGGMGFYNEPKDPMVTWVSPFNQSKVDLNWAHAPVKRYIFTLVALLVVVMVAPFLTF